jgi:hypothetical protein
MVFRILSETFLKKKAGSAPTPVAKPASKLAIIPNVISEIIDTSVNMRLMAMF